MRKEAWTVWLPLLKWRWNCKTNADLWMEKRVPLYPASHSQGFTLHQGRSVYLSSQIQQSRHSFHFIILILLPNWLDNMLQYYLKVKHYPADLNSGCQNISVIIPAVITDCHWRQDQLNLMDLFKNVLLHCHFKSTRVTATSVPNDFKFYRNITAEEEYIFSHLRLIIWLTEGYFSFSSTSWNGMLEVIILGRIVDCSMLHYQHEHSSLLVLRFQRHQIITEVC